MARVTVEDCIDKITNRFDLVVLAAHRAHAISSGAPLLIPRNNDKNPVIALREIAERKLSAESLELAVIESHQRLIEVDEPSDDDIAHMMDDDSAPDDDVSEEQLLSLLRGEPIKS